MIRSAPAAVAAPLIFACVALAQTAAPPTFEVASIKPVAPFRSPAEFRPNRGGPGTSDPTHIVWRFNVAGLIAQAYGVTFLEVLAPDGKLFYPAEPFELNATMHPGTTPEEFHMMLRSLLTERFHVSLHHVTKLFPGYDLTVAPGGPKLKASTPVESVPPPDKPQFPPTPDVPDETGFPRLRPGATAATISPGLGKWGMFRGRYRESIAQFAVGLPGLINASNGASMGSDAPRVADRTGLAGVYEFTLEFAGGTGIAPTSLLGSLQRAQNPDAPVASEPLGSGGGPTLFNALEKQLGLRLRKTKDVPVDMLVVDHADKTPTDN
jgi:uncharacterized protein (TIGR03435 family)